MSSIHALLNYLPVHLAFNITFSSYQNWHHENNKNNFDQ